MIRLTNGLIRRYCESISSFYRQKYPLRLSAPRNSDFLTFPSHDHKNQFLFKKGVFLSKVRTKGIGISETVKLRPYRGQFLLNLKSVFLKKKKCHRKGIACLWHPIKKNVICCYFFRKLGGGVKYFFTPYKGFLRHSYSLTHPLSSYVAVFLLSEWECWSY